MDVEVGHRFSLLHARLMRMRAPTKMNRVLSGPLEDKHGTLHYHRSLDCPISNQDMESSEEAEDTSPKTWVSETDEFGHHTFI